MVSSSSGSSKSVKVSQSTIDDIKKQGMAASLKAAASSTDSQFLEGVRRMYGERRYQAAINKPIDSSKAANSPYGFNGVGTPTRGDGSTSSVAASTTSNPLTALHNALSPYGNKSQKYVSPLGEGAATKKSVPGKPSIGEQISGVFTGKTSLGGKKTVESVAAENAKRMGISVSEYNARLSKKK
jgi:hypothetical protein